MHRCSLYFCIHNIQCVLDRGLYFRVISKMRSAEGPQRLGSFKLEIEDDLMFSEGEEEQLQDTSGKHRQLDD
jgi:hypothetical protein